MINHIPRYFDITTAAGERGRIFFAAMLALLTSASGVAAAAPEQHAGGITIEDPVNVGLRGYYKVGCWSPLTVTVTTDRAMDLRLTVEVIDCDGNLTSLPGTPMQLPAGTHRLRGLFRSGRLDSELRVRVDDGANNSASRYLRPSAADDSTFRPALLQSVPLIATLGHPHGFDDISAGGSAADDPTGTPTAGDTGGELLAVELDSEEELPLDADGYDGVDTLVIAGNYDLEPLRSTAVREWVQRGGDLFLAVGNGLDEYRRSSLGSWISGSGEETTPPPVPVGEGSARLRQLSGLEAFAAKGQRGVRITLPARTRRVNATRIGQIDGKVLVSELDGPVLVQVAYGLGRITFLGLDLNEPPLSTWKSVSNLLRKIVEADTDETESRKGLKRGQLVHTGITDLATQLHASQQSFPNVRRASRSTVMGLFVIYLLIIGPLDYLLVRRVLKRPELTWLTFPLMIVVAGGLAAWAAVETNGRQLLVNQLDIIDVDVKSQLVQSRTWLTLYSPETQRYRVSLTPVDLRQDREGKDVEKEQPSPTLRMTWSGIPESSFGGMYRSSGLEIGRPGYAYDTDAESIENVPIPRWSTKTLTAAWQQEVKNLFECSLESTEVGQLSGTIVHHLPVPVEDWLIAYGNRAYRPIAGRRGENDSGILPDRPLLISRTGTNIAHRELNGLLTRKTRVQANRNRQESGGNVFVDRAPYDPMMRNPDEIIRMLTFHQRAGGTSYTNLTNTSPSLSDLSDLLDLNRAVLLAKIRMRAAELNLDPTVEQRTQHWAYVRAVLPVRRTRRISTDLEEFNKRFKQGTN
jgi:hypothetical protein